MPPALALLAWATPAQAQPLAIPSSSSVAETHHTIEVSIDAEGATLLVERSFRNPGGLPATIDLPIDIPCDSILDSLALAHPDRSGWTPAPIFDAEDADARWANWLDTPGQFSSDAMRNPDTAVLMTRDTRCSADLSLFPLPPFGSQTIQYRLQVPSTYVEGRYELTLPHFDDYGKVASLQMPGASTTPGYTLTIDGIQARAGAVLDGGQEHQLVLSPQDPRRAKVELGTLDLDALIRTVPSALAALPEAERDETQPSILQATFNAPSQLVELPPIRRVVLVLDQSRSLEPRARKQLENAAQSYLEQLDAYAHASKQANLRVEILNFAREVEPMYHEFVPVRWAAEDFETDTATTRNGSNLDAALDHARTSLSAPSPVDGADWIVVFSDLDLRESFDFEAERRRVAAGGPRMHVVDIVSGTEFAPAAKTEAWTAMAQRSGGMGWELGAESGVHELAAELIEPHRIWDFRLGLELEHGPQVERQLSGVLLAGETHALRTDLPHALRRAAFSGEVWGQTRAWSAVPSPAAAMRLAGHIANNDDDYATHYDYTNDYNYTSDAIRTAVAHFAQVISPYTSAYVSVVHEGPLTQPLTGFGYGFISSCGGCSTRCGIGSLPHASVRNPVDFSSLAQQLLDACPNATSGQLQLETTDFEIVDVHTGNNCLLEESWDLDIRQTTSSGHRRVTIDYDAGRVTEFANVPT